ncbi:hypothetical protein MW887_001848 [Aspergillus wentii]|nr:hypothetical protein MW887_001848 [Aspergillus wentii]
MSTNNPHNGLSQPFNIVSWVEFGIAFLIFARFVTCWKIIDHFPIDFHLAMVTFILGTASNVMLTIGAAYGIGIPRFILTSNQIYNALLYGWVNQFMALLVIGLGKVTIVAFLLHIQGYQTRPRTILLWFIAITGLVINIIAAVLVMVQCFPIQKLFDPSIPGRCPGRKTLQVFGYVQGAVSALYDIMLAVYPISIFWGVQMFSTSTKIGLCMLMGFGIVAGVCAAIKTAKLRLLTGPSDSTSTMAEVIVWNQTEMRLFERSNAGVHCAIERLSG